MPPKTDDTRRRVRIAALALVAVALLTSAPSTFAQRWYTVELVVFERTGDENLFDESWANDPGTPLIEDSIELLDASEVALSDATNGELVATSPHAFRLLGRSAFKLRGVYNQLDRSPDFQPVLHLAWHQPGYSKRRAKRAHVRSWGATDGLDGNTEFGFASRATIDGTVKVHLGKYLHVNADLIYYRKRFQGSGEEPSANPRPPELFRLTAHRRMRSRELHYLDHPLFGLLVMITPYVAPEPEEAEDPSP